MTVTMNGPDPDDEPDPKDKPLTAKEKRELEELLDEMWGFRGEDAEDNAV